MNTRQANPRFKFDLAGIGEPEIDLAAARLKEFMSLIGYSISSEAAREGTAIILGYDKWPVLVEGLGKTPPLMMTPETPSQNRRGVAAIPKWGEEFYDGDERGYTPAEAPSMSRLERNKQLDRPASPAGVIAPLHHPVDVRASRDGKKSDTLREKLTQPPEMVEEIIFGGPWTTPARVIRQVPPKPPFEERIAKALFLAPGMHEQCSKALLTFAKSPRCRDLPDNWSASRGLLTVAAVGCYYRVCEMNGKVPSLNGLMDCFKIKGPGSFGENLARLINEEPGGSAAVSSLLFLSGIPGMSVPKVLSGEILNADSGMRTYNMISETIISQLTRFAEDVKNERS